jgi:hypothetical protein
MFLSGKRKELADVYELRPRRLPEAATGKCNSKELKEIGYG